MPVARSQRGFAPPRGPASPRDARARELLTPDKEEEPAELSWLQQQALRGRTQSEVAPRAPRPVGMVDLEIGDRRTAQGKKKVATMADLRAAQNLDSMVHGSRKRQTAELGKGGGLKTGARGGAAHAAPSGKWKIAGAGVDAIVGAKQVGELQGWDAVEKATLSGIFRGKLTLADATKEFNELRKWKPAKGSLKEKVKKFYDSDPATAFITFLILANLTLNIIQTTDTVRQNFALHSVCVILDYLALVIFTVELGARIYVLSHRVLFRAWTIMDLAIVLISWATMGASSSLRTFRVLRALRLLKMFPNLKKITEGLVLALPSLAWVLMFLLLLSTMYSILGLELYGRWGVSKCGDGVSCFSSLPAACFACPRALSTADALPLLFRFSFPLFPVAS